MFLFFNIKKNYLNFIWSQNFASVISPAYHGRHNSQEKAKTHAHALVQNGGRGKQGALWAILLSPGGGGTPWWVCAARFSILLIRNTSIHNRSSFVNHTGLQIRMGKIYTRFQTNTKQKPYPLE